MDSFSNEAGKGCIIFVVLVVALCASIDICDYHRKKNNNIIETDVELQKHNDSLRIEVNNLDSIKVNTLEVQGVKCVSCATSMDFVADSKHTNTLFDMELRAILEFYNDCYSIKIVSDNGCMEDYDNALSHDYKHIIKEIIDKLYKI